MTDRTDAIGGAGGSEACAHDGAPMKGPKSRNINEDRAEFVLFLIGVELLGFGES